MRSFKVLHHTAGPFTQNEVVTEKQILDGKHDLDGWLATHAIAEVPPQANQSQAFQGHAMSRPEVAKAVLGQALPTSQPIPAAAATQVTAEPVKTESVKA